MEYSLISGDIIRENVMLGINQIKSSSAILSELLENGSIKIVGGVHDIASGEVELFDGE